ncbi:type I-C CRISPR-associated protein Cas8c/Csd1 [Sporosarcina highlanderae]|uniref:Type I-C CRISPR-associated protein Cas8c/Csd1 n=1 Tax=Sporosarcina highlanderae TaxID=3035916 RepID=A0ABT8JNT4_9BACL|nr:type I-C CRISPR-associated protein Cas8c/Csd1 [Sporosarcina highlanderae]MDN4606803.1 type I-C CRISPR-associated protein Cas8c/Csd1 [Sporosarcina highlanderae]
MFVKRLIEFAEEHPDLFPPIGFQKKRIDWIVDIDGDRLTFNEAERIEMTVPSIARSGSGATPILLVDKPDYTFGWSAGGQDKDRSAVRHKAYMQMLEEYVAETNDRDAKALLKALNQPILVPDKMKIGDFLVFRIEDERYLHESKTVQKFWSRRVQPKPDSNSFVTQCYFCGEEAPAMERHSINFVVNRERTKMISANKNAYESHNLKNSLISPTCYECELKYGQALEYLLQRDPNVNHGEHMFSVGDVTYVYWLRGKSTNANVVTAMPFLHEANLNEMKDQYQQVFKGRQEKANFNDFCLLILSANKGRLVVRGYLEESMGVIQERIIRFLEAQEIGRGRLYSIYTLAGTIYQKPSTQLKRVDVQEWFNWTFRSTPLPGRILIALLKRIQAEGAMFPTHAAVLKSWLISQNEGREWTVKTDVTNTAPAYMLGRVFAVMEKIHGEATGSKDTLSSRYFGSASTAPRAITGMLIKNAQYHLVKISGKNKGRAINLDKRLSKLLITIDKLPATMKLTEQAEFALGYYHEKEDLWTKREDIECTAN